VFPDAVHTATGIRSRTASPVNGRLRWKGMGSDRRTTAPNRWESGGNCRTPSHSGDAASPDEGHRVDRLKRSDLGDRESGQLQTHDLARRRNRALADPRRSLRLSRGWPVAPEHDVPPI